MWYKEPDSKQRPNANKTAHKTQYTKEPAFTNKAREALVLFQDMYISHGMMEKRSALLFAMNYDALLPKSIRQNDLDMTMKLMQAERYTKRYLLRECHQTWSGLDMNHLRGWLSPPFEEGYRQLKLLFGICDLISKNSKQVHSMTDEVLMHHITKIQNTIW